MEISVLQSGAASVIRLSGDLAADERGELATTVANLLDGGRKRIVLDMSGVPYVNSAGLGALVTLSATANTRGGRVILAAPTPFFEQVLATTQLNKFFDVRATVDDALRPAGPLP